MTLQAVPGGWINTDFENMEAERPTMITQQRKSKYKHKITMPFPQHGLMDRKEMEMTGWCAESFGPGGRSKKLRWRRGWTDKELTYYFKSGKDAMMFTLRWAS